MAKKNVSVKKEKPKTAALAAPKPVSVVAPKPVAAKPALEEVIAPKPSTTSIVKPKKVQLKPIRTSNAPAPAVKSNIKKDVVADMPLDSETYFVYLKNPLEYRRHLLECCRKILLCLRSHQKLVLIRQKKVEALHKLRGSVRELLYLNKQFNDKLPKYNTGFLEGMPSQDKPTPMNVASSKARKPMPIRGERSEMDRLEESLANIEKKLKSLQ